MPLTPPPHFSSYPFPPLHLPSFKDRSKEKEREKKREDPYEILHLSLVCLPPPLTPLDLSKFPITFDLYILSSSRSPSALPPYYPHPSGPLGEGEQ